ncbi:MAG: helix-turn-helix transcriptional regulator [Planctomycetaceae bacterium]|nr:helix-turn-helix transcriptional regulator [Planctomycetaceae bacterium]
MAKANSTTSAPLTDPLRAAISESGLPLLRLAKETGVARASLIRFMREETSLRLDVADKLAKYFGLIVVPQRNSHTKKDGQ